eukprot:gene3990-7246_t
MSKVAELVVPISNETQEDACEHCEEVPKTCLCENCKVYYCDECFLIVHKAKKMRSHKKQEKSQKIPKTCEIHHKDCEFYCIDDNLQICSLCVLFDHKTHECISKEDAVKLFKKEIQNFSSEQIYSTMKLKIKKKKEEIQTNEKIYQIKLSKLKEEIEELTEKHIKEKSGLIQEGEKLTHEFENFDELLNKVNLENDIETLLEWKKLINLHAEKMSPVKGNSNIDKIDEKLKEVDGNFKRFGYYQTFEGESTHGKGFLLGSMIFVSEVCEAIKFGAHIRSCPGFAQFAIYDANNDLVCFTESCNGLPMGNIEIPFVSNAILTSGYYRLMGSFSEASSIGQTKSSESIEFFSFVPGETSFPPKCYSNKGIQNYIGNKFNYWIVTQKKSRFILGKVNLPSFVKK